MPTTPPFKAQDAAHHPCPCGLTHNYADCCQPLHQGLPAPNAEALMRSRYTAYVLMLEPYLLQTWHPDTRPDQLHLNADATTKWLGLQVKRHHHHDAHHAEVEFVARYKVNGKAERIHELSQFELINGRWYYVAGIDMA